MAELITEKLYTYFDQFEAALNLNAHQARTIVDEVRDDLMVRIASLTAQGETEEQAVTQSLEELGPPVELAQRILSEVPPLNASSIIYCRYALGGFMILFACWIWWGGRAMTWGFSPLTVLVSICFLLPIFLIIWPGIIWRKNWLFSLVPTIAAFFIVAAASILAKSETTASYPVNGSQSLQLQAVHPGDPLFRTIPTVTYLSLVVFAALTVYLLAMIQRRNQRILVLLVPLTMALIIELPFYIEESIYRQNVQSLDMKLKAYQADHATLPSQKQYANLSAKWGADLHIKYKPGEAGQHYTLFLDRSLDSGCAMCFDSKHGWFWVND